MCVDRQPVFVRYEHIIKYVLSICGHLFSCMLIIKNSTKAQWWNQKNLWPVDMQPQTQGRLWVGRHAAEDVPGTGECRRWGDGPGWWCRGGGLGCGGVLWPARAWHGTGRWWSPRRWRVQRLLQWLRLWQLQPPKTPCWPHCHGHHSWIPWAFCLSPRLPHSAQRSPSADLSPRPLTAHTASTTGERPQTEPQDTHLPPWLLPLLPCRPSPASHCPGGTQRQVGTEWNMSINHSFYLMYHNKSCIMCRAVKVSALIYAINVAAINAIKYFNAVNATLFTSGVC